MTNVTSDNITLLYEHPHISMYVTDNTVYKESQPEVTEKSFNGIQVGFFESGRDNNLLYCRSASEYLNEYGNPNYKLYGQAGYNAYNALSTNYAGMYILRLMPENATLSNTVIMAKYKLIDEVAEENPITGDMFAELFGKNTVKEMVPNEGTTEPNTHAYELRGDVVSGMVDDVEISGLFSHITPEFLSGNNLGNFTVSVLKIPVPTGVIVGENVTIRQTSVALKKFYADMGEDSDRIVANTDGVTATKTARYTAEDILEGNNYITLAFLVAESDTVYLEVDWSDTDTESIIVKTSGLNFVESIPEIAPMKKLAIAYEAVHVENATSENDLKSKIAGLYRDDLDENGFSYVPLMAFWSLGRGKYGGSLRIKFEDANEYESSIEPTVRSYCMSVLQNMTTGLEEKEYIYGSLDEDLLDTDSEIGPSLFIPDIVNDLDNGSGKVHAYVNSIVLSDMLDKLNSTITDEDEHETIRTFDPIFGRTLTGEEHEHIKMLDNSSDEGYVNLTSVDGFCLGAGSDGDLDLDSHTEEEINDTKEQLLIQAFERKIDKRIGSRFSSPANFCLDANFSQNTKAAMAAFAKHRKYDCMTYIDTGLSKTATDVITKLKSMIKLSSNNLVKEPHCYMYRDRKFTGKSCEMTITHWFAKAFPIHIQTYGIGEPFAKNRARITNSDFVSGSFAPIIDPDEHDIKRQIYKCSANCFETVKFNVYQRSSAITTYELQSDRKDEFNEFITQKAVKVAHDLLSSKIYKIAEDEDRRTFEKDATKLIGIELSGLVKTCSVAFEMTNRDKRKGILRLKLRLTFKTVAKYGVCELYLDPRVIDEALAA